MKNSVFDDMILRGGLVKNKNQLQLFNNLQFSMYPARAFALVLQKLFNEKGIEYVKELGKIMGDSSAKSIYNSIKELKSFIKKDYQKISNLIEISGFGKIEEYLEDKNSIKIKIKDHAVISPSLNLYGEKSCAFYFYAEIYKSYIKVFKGAEVKLNPELSKSGDVCEWMFDNVESKN